MSDPPPSTPPVPVAAPVPVPVVAVGGIAVVEGALLMVQRARPPGVGRWTVPGGRVEPGESVVAAVERELMEETALAVRCGPFVGWAERRGMDHHFVILDFEVTVTGETTPTAGGDAAAAVWVPLAEVVALDLVEGLEDFLIRHGVLA
ncbi:MAG TPA: NUDIX domain-containing protein [Acidimicrobiales bacterium]|nr:NUDIX domain-containing protein [Acidimicrobiales bacterium]